MKTEFTRQEAHDFLADLLVDENDIKQQTLFDVPRDYTPKKGPKWIVQGITLVYVMHPCANCGEEHSHTSPKLLLNEALIDSDGTVLKTNQTISPKQFNVETEEVSNGGDPVAIASLPIKNEYLIGEATDFCSECIHEMSDEMLQRLFVMQQMRRTKKAAGERMERIAEAQAKVAGKKMPSADKANMLADLLTADANDSTDEEL